MFRSILGSPLKTESLVSEESPYFSLYLCKIVGESDVAFRRYERKSSELLDILYTTFSGILVLLSVRDIVGVFFPIVAIVLCYSCLNCLPRDFNRHLVFSISNFA